MMGEPFKIYGAVYVFLRRGEKTFLMRRANTGYRDGFWSLPAGHIEQGESLAVAAARELKEESGLDVRPEALTLRHAMFRRSDRTYADYYFTCDMWQGEPQITELHKCDAAEWFAMNDLPPQTVSEVGLAAASILRGEPFSEIVTAGREGK